MTETLRSINVTHPKAPNLTMRIGVFTPDVLGPTAKPDGQRSAVVEFHARNSNGHHEHVGTLTLEQFTDFAREIVRIGQTVVPEPSVEESVTEVVNDESAS